MNTPPKPSPPQWAADLQKSLEKGFDRLQGDVDVLVEDGKRTNQRLTRVEERIDEFDGRLMRTSSRVKAPSEHDLEAQSQLAQERAAREALATKVTSLTASQAQQTQMITDIRNAVVGVVTNKKLRYLAALAVAIVTTLLLNYARKHGVEVLP